MEDDHPDLPGARTDELPWPLSGADALRAELLSAYGDPTRGHHDVRHLTEVIHRLQELAAAGARYDETPVLLAAWFHDAVYDGERDAEERSAAWAEHALPDVTDEATVAEVARLVRLTEHHRPTPDDANGCALSDADLAILGAPIDRYEEYASAVRAEYGHLPDDVFAEGRATVLRQLTSEPQLFHTTHGRAHWEARARENVARELEKLDVAG
ncbi:MULTISPECIES: hypothetical protein [Nocardioides]|uniref:Metal-dependent phosphohydrolase n=1 Tax=Nocardioides vastitatis TaxID=2568655 RepID=A0ABW0ZBU8_9ACTN|nr:hypothetical protein [Nocardioides sp.]THI95693.1 hypothetical protein E7Z54_18415 [Nocardioides sp.]